MPGAIEQVLENQAAIMRSLKDLALDNRLDHEWYTAAECSRLKGISQAYLTVNRWAQPLGGAGRMRIGGRLRWHRSVVKEWLQASDETLLKLYGAGLPAASPHPSRRTA